MRKSELIEMTVSELETKLQDNSESLQNFRFQKALQQLNLDDRQMAWTEAIINSMTPEERHQPQLINGSRRLRIARGSGRPVQDINALLKQFTTMKKMMKKMGKIKNFGLPEMDTVGRFN